MIQFEKLQEHLKNNQYTWLVTGNAGFIGSNLVEALLKLNQKVVGMDNFSTGYQKNIDDVLEQVGQKLAANFVFHEADIRSFEDCQSAVQGVDFVLHQAALGSVPRSIETPLVTNDSNVSGFLNILTAAKDAKVKRFVYASSSSVYGDSPKLPKVESDIGKPLSPYAASKFTDEIYAQAYGNCYDITTVGLRYFNVFGKRQDPNGAYAAVIPCWLSALIKEQDVYINGDGTTSRDFCYIANVVQINLLAAMATEGEAVNTVYNVAVNEQTNLNELYKLLADSLRLDSPRDPVYRDFRPGDIKHSLADISKACDLLGYAPTHKIKEGLAEAIEWYVGDLS